MAVIERGGDAGRGFGLVQPKRARPPVAPDARPVRDPRLGGDAAADAGRRASCRATWNGSSAGRPSRRSPPRRRLTSSRRGAGSGTTAVRSTCTGAPRRSSRAAAFRGEPGELRKLPGIGPVHRRGDRLLRIRRPDRRSRHQRPSRARAGLPRHRRRDPRRAAPTTGTRPSSTSAARSASPERRAAAPARSQSGCPSRGQHLRTASPPDPLRGLVPAAARAAPARDRSGRRAARGRLRRRGARLARPRRPGRGLRRRGPAARSDEPCDQLGQPVERAQLGVGRVALRAAPGRPC